LQELQASYVGQTKKQLKTRIKEYINNIKLEPLKYSVISEYILNYKHFFIGKILTSLTEKITITKD